MLFKHCGIAQRHSNNSLQQVRTVVSQPSKNAQKDMNRWHRPRQLNNNSFVPCTHEENPRSNDETYIQSLFEIEDIRKKETAFRRLKREREN